MVNIHPIETLYDRIINTFENTSEIIQARLTTYHELVLNRYIKIETESFGTPYSDHKTKEIVLNKRFLCLVWSITYIILEIAQNKSKTAINITNTYMVMNKEDSEIQELDYLFDWAFSLKDAGSNDEWPQNLPMPTLTTINARIANIIFIDSINYIMFHEVAHIVNGHWGSYKEIDAKLKNEDILNEEDKILCIQLEQEADTFAYDCLVSSQNDEETRYHKHLGIIIAGLSSMFALKKGTKLYSITHPSVHVRVFNLHKQSQFNEGDEFHLGRIMNIGLSMFCKLNNITYEDKGFQNFDEILNYFFELLDANKTKELSC